MPLKRNGNGECPVMPCIVFKTSTEKFSAAGKNFISLIEPRSGLLPVYVYFIANTYRRQLDASKMRNKNTTGVD